jgi:hypothetical protein
MNGVRDYKRERSARKERGAERPGYGDDHWTRRMPERMPRGDDHWSKRMPERIPRGDRSGARLHPESVCRGEAHPDSKLNEEEVRRIREAHAHGATQARLACVYGVTKENIGYIVRRATWKHLA